ncbi:hypothetical protein Gotur_025386 [Gossypium turneri]
MLPLLLSKLWQTRQWNTHHPISVTFSVKERLLKISRINEKHLN